MTCRVRGRVGQRIPRLAREAAEPAGPGGSRASRGDPRHPRRQRRRLGVAPRPRPAAEPGPDGRAQPRRPPHARGGPPRPGRVAPAGPDRGQPAFPSHRARQDRAGLAAFAPDQVWLADPTCVPAGEGRLRLAALIGMHTREVVGWAMRETLHAGIAVEAPGWPPSASARPRGSSSTRVAAGDAQPTRTPECLPPPASPPRGAGAAAASSSSRSAPADRTARGTARRRRTRRTRRRGASSARSRSSAPTTASTPPATRRAGTRSGASRAAATHARRIRPSAAGHQPTWSAWRPNPVHQSGGRSVRRVPPRAEPLGSRPWAPLAGGDPVEAHRGCASAAPRLCPAGRDRRGEPGPPFGIRSQPPGAAPSDAWPPARRSPPGSTARGRARAARPAAGRRTAARRHAGRETPRPRPRAPRRAFVAPPPARPRQAGRPPRRAGARRRCRCLRPWAHRCRSEVPAGFVTRLDTPPRTTSHTFGHGCRPIVASA